MNTVQKPTKKIVIDARESGTSTGRYIDKLIEHMHAITSAKPNYDITILTKPHRLEFMAGIAPSYHHIASPYKEFTFAEQIGFRKQLNGLYADLVHFTAVQQPVLYRGNHVTTMHDLTTARFRNPAKNPVVFTIKQQVYKWVNRRAAHTSSAIITPSEFVKQDVAAFCRIHPDKITVTHEAADELPTPATPVDGLQNARFIMYIGRPTPHKNLERLIDAFAQVSQTERLSQTNRNLHLVLVGKKDANYERIAAMVARRSIDRVVFTGFIDDQQLRWLYENCLAYVFPSLSEGFGLPALEAMQHGAAVVSSNATCLPEICGDAALYFDPTDTAGMAVAISTMLGDHSLRAAFVAKGRRQAATYSWRRMAEQTLAVYKKALGD